MGEVTPTPGPIMAFGAWKTNAELVVACRDLGYLDDEHIVWDTTYGKGAFWRRWRPRYLFGSDLDPAKCSSIHIDPVDVRRPPFQPRAMHHIVFDPPYKLNGRPDPVVDERYGVAERVNRAGRMDIITGGVTALADILGDGYLLVKCMDQVNGGRVRWVTDDVTDAARAGGLTKVDRLDMPSYRPQPAGRRQVHARRNVSTMLVFAR